MDDRLDQKIGALASLSRSGRRPKGNHGPPIDVAGARKRCRFVHRIARCCLVLTLMPAQGVAAQQRPLDTQDPEPVGVGSVRVSVGTTYVRDEFYPLSGLRGNLLQVPVVALDVGLGPIADFQLSGGPYNRLSITDRRPAPLAGLVTATGATTHAVEDIVIGTKIRLMPEHGRRPAVGFRFAVRLPNAKHESGLGQDTTDFASALLVGKTLGALRLVANGGLMIMSEPLDAARQNDVLTYGASLTFATMSHTDLVGEINGRWSMRRGTAPVGTESRGLVKVGGRHTRGPWQLDAAAVFGATSIDPTVGITVGITWMFRAFSFP